MIVVADQEGLIQNFPALLERLEQAGFRMEASLKILLLKRHRERRYGPASIAE